LNSWNVTKQIDRMGSGNWKEDRKTSTKAEKVKAREKEDWRGL